VRFGTIEPSEDRVSCRAKAKLWRHRLRRLVPGAAACPARHEQQCHLSAPSTDSKHEGTLPAVGYRPVTSQQPACGCWSIAIMSQCSAEPSRAQRFNTPQYQPRRHSRKLRSRVEQRLRIGNACLASSLCGLQNATCKQTSPSQNAIVAAEQDRSITNYRQCCTEMRTNHKGKHRCSGWGMT
jgi:hypothetical protein